MTKNEAAANPLSKFPLTAEEAARPVVVVSAPPENRPAEILPDRTSGLSMGNPRGKGQRFRVRMIVTDQYTGEYVVGVQKDDVLASALYEDANRPVSAVKALRYLLGAEVEEE